MDFTKILQTALELLAPPLVAMLAVVLWKVYEKLKQQVGQGKAAEAAYWARMAIQFVAELRAAREKSGGTLSAQEAVREAVEFIMRNSKVTEGKALDVLHAVLPETGEGAAASMRVPFVKAPETAQ